MTKSPNIWRVAIASPLRRLFDYYPAPEAPETVLPGCRVEVPFGSRRLVGFLIEQATESEVPANKLKPAYAVLDVVPLFSADLLNLMQWASRYYHHALGEVMLSGLPAALKRGKPLPKEPKEKISDRIPSPWTLTEAQQACLAPLEQAIGTAQTFLLHGVTGSGKTEIYLRWLETLQSTGKQALVLIPEISLTPQTLLRFSERFGEVVWAYHSQMTDKQRLLTWQAAMTGRAKIIVGTRSATFLPFINLGGIIVDEEHDLAFKQQEGFRYHARDLSIVRAQRAKCPVLLGSATPSFESQHNAACGRYTLLTLPERVGDAKMPAITLLDVRHKKLQGGLSAQLLALMKKHVNNNHQVLIFLNRRGFSPCWMCFDCGWFSECSRCDVRLTYHKLNNCLLCHHCGQHRPLPRQCPECNGRTLSPLGLGTEQLEDVLHGHFPDKNIVRIDSDTTRRKGQLAEKLSSIISGEADILIGTQLLTKGHHFPKVTLVAILDADGGLFSQDFRAVERMGQLITQVAGRAGREADAGEVAIQSFHPTHPLLQRLIHTGYLPFSEALLEERKLAALPPYSYMALVRAESHQVEVAMKLLTQLRDAAAPFAAHNVSVLGPIPPTMPKRGGRYRVQLMLLAEQRAALHACLTPLVKTLESDKNARKVRCSVDIDPVEVF